jgi:amino acid adenylation domain-containing protein
MKWISPHAAVAAGRCLCSSPRLVHEQFERLAADSPERVAAVLDGQSISYGALNARANQLARRMLQRGVSKGDFVTILMDRSIHTLASILSVIKLGAAYVPLDPSLPAKRVLAILDDCGSDIILADGAGLRLLADTDVFMSAGLIEVEDERHYTGDASDIGTCVEGGDLVYCIYTSGSTGSPKGVMVHHEGLRNYVNWAADCYVTESIRNFAFLSPLAFDLTVTSIFVPLVSGCSIHIYPDIAGADLPVVRAIREKLVDILKLTPAHLALIARLEFMNPRLQAMIVGGEDLKVDVAKRVHRQFSQELVIYNEYGPTETTVGCMVHRFDPQKDVAGSVPIGRPIDNTRIYLLDRDMKEVPAGTVGHLHIAGAGVALGYKNKPDLTAASFIPDCRIIGGTMYASGDLARCNVSGELIYLGRSDDQVKINGYRVELVEIETRLITHPAIIECVVDTLHRPGLPPGADELIHCSQCGLALNFPNTSYDENNVCNHCRAFTRYRSVLESYFLSIDDLRHLIEKIQRRGESSFDCLFLLSGGKDSTYALCKMVELGARVLAITLDPGYLSNFAKENIERTVSRLGIEHRYLRTSAMKEIFVDSLMRHSNVCNGCFKTLYTLSVNLALELGVGYIVTGLSRGQLFETRLTNLYKSDTYNEAKIEQQILDARKIYHRMEDAVSRLLDTRCFQSDDVFEKVCFIDFYRYTDVSVEQIYHYLETEVGWKRPTDTGRSTNCLINNTGIYIHNKERGYHNYSLPYSWDVRLGHKTRSQAMRELDDLAEIDVADVRRILNDIGYGYDHIVEAEADSRLVGYYVAEEELPPEQLREFLLQELPEYMVPSYFVHLDKLPLTTNGKVNRRALPKPEFKRRYSTAGYVAPRGETERTLVNLWREVLKVQKVGVHDNFFDLGGNSLTAVLLLFNVAESFDKRISIREFTQLPTVAMLASYLDGTGHCQVNSP